MKDSRLFDFSRKDDFCWVSMIRLPDFVTREEFDWATREAKEKKSEPPVQEKQEFITQSLDNDKKE